MPKCNLFRLVAAVIFVAMCFLLIAEQECPTRRGQFLKSEVPCHGNDLQSAVLSVQGEVLARKVGTFAGTPMSTAEFFGIHRCIGRPSDRRHWISNSEGIAYIVMASKNTRDRAEALLRHWGKHVPTALMRMYSDVDDPSVRMITLPELAGRGSYVDAQHRPLKGLQHALTTEPFKSAEFIMFADDDTFVNLPQLRYFASQWNPDVPALFGYMWLRTSATWPSGGGGMLVTRAAAKMLAESLYTPACPFDDGHDDVTIGHCCWRLNIPLVHSNQFDSMGELYKALEPPLSNNAILTSAIAIHRADPERMSQLHQLYETLSR